VGLKEFFAFVGLALASISLVTLRPSEQSMLISSYALSAFMILAGLMHFNPNAMKLYRAIMPPFLPFPDLLIYITGVLEAGAGAYTLYNRSVGAQAVFGILLLIYPANIYCAVCFVSVKERLPVVMPLWFAWLRLPIQGVFLYWAYQLF